MDQLTDGRNVLNGNRLTISFVHSGEYLPGRLQFRIYPQISYLFRVWKYSLRCHTLQLTGKVATYVVRVFEKYWWFIVLWSVANCEDQSYLYKVWLIVFQWLMITCQLF